MQIKNDADRMTIQMFASMALMGIMTGRQLSGKSINIENVTEEAVRIGISAEKRMRELVPRD